MLIPLRFIRTSQAGHYIVFSISHENRTYRENAKSVHNEKFNFVLSGLNLIIHTKIINNIIVFRILKKYYKKMAMQLLTPIWHVIPLRHNE